MSLIDTSYIDRAIIFAVNAHKGQQRKGKGFAYVIHPLEALAIASTMTNDQELLAAAVLHDVVEDTHFTIEDIKNQFGDKVAEIVMAETDKIYNADNNSTWFERKSATIERLKLASKEVKIVALSDKLSNMRAIARDYSRLGEQVWDLFHVKNRKDHEWHYRGLLASLSELYYTEAYREFSLLIKKVFGE